LARKFVETVNPATGEKIGRYRTHSREEVIRKARKAASVFESTWKKLSIEERSNYMRRLAKALRNKKDVYSTLITKEMGKPISQSVAEVEKCAWTAEVYAENGRAWLADELGKTDAALSYVTFQPLGVVLSIMPWNFPFWQAFRFAIPALLAGNTSILRHSNVCPGSSLAIEESFDDAGFPDGVFASVITEHEAVSRLIESNLIQGVSLTGSVRAGQEVSELAARNLKKFVLELGGSDPFIVLEDADVEKAAKVGSDARLISSGQSCIAAKRFIVVKSVAKQFTEAFVRQMEGKRTGDPMDPETDVGPLVNREQVQILDKQVKDAVSKKAEVLLGGRPRDGPGAFYEPTVLSKVSTRMKVMREEVFGPVAPIYVASDEREAIRVANASDFGLGASLWASDAARARMLAAQIQSGVVFVNALVKSDPRMPFGGIKRSGTGRELSKYGLKEFVNVKSVNMYDVGLPPRPEEGLVE
jgi:acyl-CoA reductase-like NAD-dependent aldehyde dehydrogenase